MIVPSMKRDKFKESENYKMHYREQLDDKLSGVRIVNLDENMIYHISTQGASNIVNSVGFSVHSGHFEEDDLSNIIPEKLLVSREVNMRLEETQDRTEVFECHKFQGNTDSINIDFKPI